MFGIPLALGVFAVGEWATHRYLLHGLGRDKRSRFAFHFHAHHQSVRKHGGYDPDYEGPPWTTITQAGEALSLIAVGVAHLPLLPVAPLYTATIWYLLGKYRRDHRRAHLDPEWARVHLPHHYDHHLGDQNQNWGVTFDWVDRMLGTRDRYVGTDKERADARRNADRAGKAAAGKPERRMQRRRLAEVVRELRDEALGRTRRRAA